MSSPKPASGGAQGLCEQGLALHRSGRLDEAREFYKRALQRDAKHFTTLHVFGTLCVQAGQAELGAALLRRALAVNPDAAAVHAVLGAAQEGLGDLIEALASYDKAARLQPGHVEAHYNRAGVLRRLGRRDEALAGYETAVRLAPGFAEANYNLGLVLGEMGRHAEAIEVYGRAIAVKPDLAEAWFNRGLSLNALGRHDEALANFEGALARRPGLIDARYSRALALQTLNRRYEALAELGAVVELKPDDADAHYAHGLVLHELQRPREAIASFDRALAMQPGVVRTLFARSLSLLLAGKMEEGWREYEWRLHTPEMAGELRGGDAPAWKGEPLEGKVLYVHCEQGLGDTLQFCRYAPLVGLGSRLILEVQAPLERLMASLPGGARVIVQGAPLPDFDLHCSLLSLPTILGSEARARADGRPYLAADPAAARAWRTRLDDLPGLKVGLVWSGGQRPGQPNAAAIDRRRSVTLQAMAPLGEVAGVTFVSLQKGPPAEQAAAPPAGLSLIDFTAELADFADTAALVEALDLVISVDTSVAHLAGALGRPVWMLNRYDTCWRWLLERDDSDLYQSLRQFRQAEPGDWPGVMTRVRDALSAQVSEAGVGIG